MEKHFRFPKNIIDITHTREQDNVLREEKLIVSNVNKSRLDRLYVISELLVNTDTDISVHIDPISVSVYRYRYQYLLELS